MDHDRELPGSVWQLVYTSHAIVPITDAMLHDLQNKARGRNEMLGITGFLLVCNGMFLQLLEGDAFAIEQVFERINSDPRHEEIDVVFSGYARERCVPAWSMGVIMADRDCGHEQESPLVPLYEQGLACSTVPPNVRQRLRQRLGEVLAAGAQDAA